MNRTQTILTIACIALLAGLYLMGTRHVPPAQQNKAAMGGANRDGGSTAAAAPPPVIDLVKLSTALKDKLPAANKASIEQLEKRLAAATTPAQKAPLYKDLALQWEKARYIEVAAVYSYKVAQTDSTLAHWKRAAQQLEEASLISADSTMRPYLLAQTTQALERCQQLEPNNLDTQVALGTAYIEAAGNDASQVMKGVMLLREVVAQDTTHVNANLVLGRMAVVSGQLDKAIPRLQYVTQLDPNNAEAYYYLGEAFAQKGEKDNAIKMLEKSKSLAKNTTFVRQIQQVINSL